MGSFPGKFYQYQQAAVASHFPRWNCTKAQAMPQTESQRWHHERQGSHSTCSVHKGKRTSLRPDPLKTQGSGSVASREDDATLSQVQGDQSPSNGRAGPGSDSPDKTGALGCVPPLPTQANGHPWGYPRRMHQTARKQRHPDAGVARSRKGISITSHFEKALSNMPFDPRNHLARVKYITRSPV